MDPADRFIPSPSCLTLQYQIQTERQRIQTEFNQLRSILDSEERRELQKLEEEEKKTLDSLAVAEAELVQQGELLKDCMKCSLGISNFLEAISSLSHSVVFL